MLRPYSLSSFYLDGELIDLNWLEWNCRNPNGSRNHKRIQALTKLKLAAENLFMGYHDTTEDLIYTWLQEAK